MAIRTGMGDLLDRLRGLTNVDIDQYTVATLSYWNDQQLQDTLDGHTEFLVDHPLTWRPQNISSTTTYLIAEAAYRNWEKATSGTTRWIVRNSTGTEVGTANYSVDYRVGRLTFAADQGGTAYYLTGYSYDVYGAAVEILEHKLAYVDLWYDFSADNQSFSRSQVIKNLEAQIQRYETKSGENAFGDSDLRRAVFVRTDLN